MQRSIVIINIIRGLKNYLVKMWRQKKITTARLTTYIVVVYLVSLVAITCYENRQLKMLDVDVYAAQLNNQLDVNPGAYQAATYALVVENLLQKPGGIISNDVFFPGVWLDDMPNWELGVVSYLRQMLVVYQDQPGNSELFNKQYGAALNHLKTPLNAWPFPSSQAEYTKALDIFKSEFARLNALHAGVSPTKRNNDLSVRVVKAWLSEVSNSLEKYNNLLLASASDHSVLSDVVSYQASEPLNILDAKTTSITQAVDTTADATATLTVDENQTPAVKPKEAIAATKQANELDPKNTFAQTSWLDIDDVFFQSRGYVWAFLHFLQAFEKDHPELLKSKAKQAALQIVMDELTAAQQPLWSPMVLNGKGMGVLANHSLVLASHVESAQEALQKLHALL